MKQLAPVTLSVQRSRILMVSNDSCDSFIRCFKNICGVFNYLLVYLFVCLSPTFSDMVRFGRLVFRTKLGYKSETKPIDFGVNQYIFKVTGVKKVHFIFAPVVKAYE